MPSKKSIGCYNDRLRIFPQVAHSHSTGNNFSGVYFSLDDPMKEDDMVQMNEKVRQYLDTRNYNFIRAAAASPVVHRANPAKNAETHLKMVFELYAKGAQLIVFPELSMRGYTIQDIHMHAQLQKKEDRAVKQFLIDTKAVNAMLFFGAGLIINDLLFNVMYATLRGQILCAFVKESPPNYGEFTELRWFHGADELPQKTVTKFGQTFPVGNDLVLFDTMSELSVGGDICEDRWLPVPPSTLAAMHGAKILVNGSASPFELEKPHWRRHLAERSGDDIAASILANASHGESGMGLNFDGQSIIAERGKILVENDRFQVVDSFIMHDIDLDAIRADRMRIHSWGINAKKMRAAFPFRYIPFEGLLGYDNQEVYYTFMRQFNPEPFVPQNQQDIWDIHMARVIGWYTRLKHLPEDKRKVIIGVSGGQDSTDNLMLLVRVVDMFGNELKMTRKDIIGMTMPGFGTTEDTFNYANELAEELGITFETVDIRDMAQRVFEIIGEPQLLKKVLEKTATEQEKVMFGNVQAWLRAYLELSKSSAGGIMAHTGSSSEIWIGWYTLFADGSGHYSGNAGTGKSVIPVELEWLAEMVYVRPEEARLANLLRAIARHAPSPENLPTTEDGKASEISDDINGPTNIRDFFTYWLLRQRRSASTILRIAIATYCNEEDPNAPTPKQLDAWLRTFIWRLFANWFKANMQRIDTTKIGTVSPDSHDVTKIPSDIKATIWMEDLDEEVPVEFSSQPRKTYAAS
jgi:NAD+ synthase (glutamine-hydrolysing)